MCVLLILLIFYMNWDACCAQVWLADWLIANNPNKPSVVNDNVVEP